MRLPLKQPSSVGVWSRYGKKLKLAAKIRLTKCFLITSSTWLNNVYAYIQIQETDFKCYLQKWKVTSNFIFNCQTSWRLLGESFFHNILELQKGRGYFLWTGTSEAKFGNYLDFILCLRKLLALLCGCVKVSHTLKVYLHPLQKE